MTGSVMRNVWVAGATTLAAGVMVTGCSKDASGGPRRAPPDAVPSSVHIGATELESGVYLGKLRDKVQVAGFAISRSPTTVAQYARCVDAGGCSEPASKAPACGVQDLGVDGATYGVVANRPELANSTAVTCVTAAQAQQFCRWAGGGLARVDQWLLAARGPNVQRFAWGSSQPTCELHWRTSLASRNPCCEACGREDASQLGSHPAGDSPFGLGDVLATQAELVLPAQRLLLGCSPSSKGCVVSGLIPGAIDFVSTDSGNSVSSFRCVWED